MKKIIFVVFTIFAFTACQQQKIAYIDNGKVINEFEEKKDIEAKYKIKIDAYNAKRDSLGKVLQLEYQDFQIKSKSMPQKKAQGIYDALIQKQQLLQKQFQVEEQQIAQQSQKEIDTLIVKVKDYVKDYGKKNGYTYILGTSEGAASVLYGTEENDLSQTILDALNADYKKEE